jgi:hypothetical protein
VQPHLYSRYFVEWLVCILSRNTAEVQTIEDSVAERTVLGWQEKHDVYGCLITVQILESLYPNRVYLRGTDFKHKLSGNFLGTVSAQIYSFCEVQTSFGDLLA